MEHGTHLVDLVDEKGIVVGNKHRRDIDKQIDRYHAVYTLLVSPEGQVVFARIPERKDLPNLYVGQLGVPSATIRRTGESPEEAARRAIARELYIDDAEVVHVGDGLLTLDDGRQTYASLFYMVADMPETFSSTDISEIALLSPREIDTRIASHPDEFAPTMRLLWKTYRSKLPL
jgi:ADP-ribose pyrophosphatase YjhB (NUDIX family)